MKENLSARDELDRAITIVLRSRRFWRRALITCVAVFAVAAGVSLTRPRRYMSETVILYREALRPLDITGSEGFGSDPRRLGLRLREVLMSRTSLEPIIVEFDLYPAILARRTIVDAVEEMRRNIQFKAREGDTFLITFEAPDPGLAERVTARLGSCIIEEASRRRSEQARLLKEFLEAESARSAVELKEKEAALAKFLGLHPGFATLTKGAADPVRGLATPALAPPRSTDPVLGPLEARAAKIERRLRAAVPGTQSTAKTRSVADEPDVIEARRDVTQKKAQFTEKHPDVIAALAHLRQVEAAAQRRIEAEQPEKSAPASDSNAAPPLDDTQRATLKDELVDLNKQMEARRKEIGIAGAPVPELVADEHPVNQEVEFLRLQREVVDTRERQRQLEDRQFKAAITMNSVEGDRNIQVSILDKAYRPSHPISTGRTIMLAGAMAAALLMALLVALLSAIFDDVIYDPTDLRGLDLVPLLGVIPRAAAARK